MTAADTLYAYQAGLITEAEAAEQALVEQLDDLYEQVGGSVGYRASRGQDAERRRERPTA